MQAGLQAADRQLKTELKTNLKSSRSLPALPSRRPARSVAAASVEQPTSVELVEAPEEAEEATPRELLRRSMQAMAVALEGSSTSASGRPAPPVASRRRVTFKPPKARPNDAMLRLAMHLVAEPRQPAPSGKPYLFDL